MKRPLEVVQRDGGADEPVNFELDLGRTSVTVSEVGSGEEAARFAELLVSAGAKHRAVPSPVHRALRIVVRTTPREREAVQRLAELEAEADVVLGSARPAFATWLATLLLGE